MKKIFFPILFALIYLPSVFCQPIAIQDSLALVDLYYSANGEDWYDNNDWLILPVDEWMGVIISNNRVIYLVLGENNLHGFIPPSIGNLTELYYLDLSGNYLEGPIPESIGNLVSLEYLYLEQNQLTSIPDSIGYCISLKRIYLHMNQLSGQLPASIGNLVNLTNLSLSENQLTGEIPASFENLISLEGLSLQHNQLTGTIPEPLCNLSVNLRWLILSHNQLSGPIPEYIGNLTNIYYLWLDHNNFSKSIPATISNLPNIRELHLEYNNLTDEIPQNLGDVNYIYPYPIFYFNNNNLSGVIPVSLLNYIQIELYLQNNHFSELPDFSGMQYEPWLYLQNNNFTFEDIEPNIYFDTLYYIPQDSVLDTDTLTAVVDSPFVISSKIGGTANHYQWYKNGDSITGATDSVLYFPAVAWSDSGFYTCRITNDIVTDLTLWRHTVTLWVTDTLTGVRPKTQDSNFKSQISILPNPVLRGETVFVELPEEYDCRELRIYGVAGGQVMAIPLQRNRTVIKFSSAGLEHGVYFVKVVVGDGRSYVEKFVVY